MACFNVKHFYTTVAIFTLTGWPSTREKNYCQRAGGFDKSQFHAATVDMGLEFGVG